MVYNMPQWAMGITDGIITEWNVAVGDEVEKGDTLCEIDEGKLVDVFESPASGKIVKIYGEQGDSIACGDPLIEIE